MVGDIERGSPGSQRGSPSPRKRDMRGATIELGPLQLLALIVGIGIIVFGATLLYFHEFLHFENMDLGGLRLSDHPMINTELGELQRAFKQLAPSFNEFTHFSEDTTTTTSGISSSRGSSSAEAAAGAKKVRKEKPHVSHHVSPENFEDTYGNGPNAQMWAALDDSRYSRMTRKRATLEGQAVPHHHLHCSGKELVEFWKESSLDDLAYETPYAMPEGSDTKYVTFEPDVGGWNNIRMQMELVLVFAAATGRTLVLPPDQPMYLLDKGKGKDKHHSFADFFPFDFIKSRVPVISMKEFIDQEAKTGRLKNNQNGKTAMPPPGCDGTSGVERDKRNQLWDYLRNSTSCPPWKGMKDFLVIPPRPGMNTTTDLPPMQSKKYEEAMKVFAGDPRYGMDRKAQFYDTYWHDQHVIHFISKPAWGYRLLEHFYTYIHFQDPEMDRFYKRFVRDYVHYVDLIFCKAAMIIQALKKEGDGKFSSFHVRRGEFQYKAVKIPAADIVTNVGHHIPENRLIYVATDEKKKGFFDAFKKRWSNVRYLDDYMDMAGLRDINPNFLGMIDAMVCTRGEEFIGTWFSTFTGYITRMRGYMGYPDNLTWYGDKEHMNRNQEYEFPRFPFYMRENSISWFGIDEDHKDYWAKYFKKHPLFIDDDPWGKKKRKKEQQQKTKKKNGEREKVMKRT